MTTKRYCLICDKLTDYAYDRNIAHSYCKECGNRGGINPNNAVLKHFQEKIKKIKEVGVKSKWIEKVINQRRAITILEEKIKGEIMDKKLLWKFLEKWTTPEDENAIFQWKEELDKIFM